MEWNSLPWRRCRAVLEKQGDAAYWGRCDRNRQHKGLHALERGFDVIWFETRVVNVHQEWDTLSAYAKSDISFTEGFLSRHRVCDCSAHDITESGSSHANDCPAYDGPNPVR